MRFIAGCWKWNFHFTSKQYILRRDGGNTVSGNINFNSHKLVNVATPTNNKDAANKEYVDANSGVDKVSKSGDTMTGDLLLSSAVQPQSENSAVIIFKMALHLVCYLVMNLTRFTMIIQMLKYQ